MAAQSIEPVDIIAAPDSAPIYSVALTAAAPVAATLDTSNSVADDSAAATAVIQLGASAANPVVTSPITVQVSNPIVDPVAVAAAPAAVALAAVPISNPPANAVFAAAVQSLDTPLASPIAVTAAATAATTVDAPPIKSAMDDSGFVPALSQTSAGDVMTADTRMVLPEGQFDLTLIQPLSAAPSLVTMADTSVQTATCFDLLAGGSHTAESAVEEYRFVQGPSCTTSCWGERLT